MNKNYGRKCPYCKKKVSLFYVSTHLRDGEYTCNECKKYSNVKYNNLFYLFLIIAAVFGAVLGLVLFKESLKGVILSAVPFLCLYISLPLFYKLVPIKIKQKNKDIGKNPNIKNEPEIKQYVPKSKRTNETLKNNNYPDDGTDGTTKYIPDIK